MKDSGVGPSLNLECCSRPTGHIMPDDGDCIGDDDEVYVYMGLCATKNDQFIELYQDEV